MLSREGGTYDLESFEILHAQVGDHVLLGALQVELFQVPGLEGQHVHGGEGSCTVSTGKIPKISVANGPGCCTWILHWVE